MQSNSVIFGTASGSLGNLILQRNFQKNILRSRNLSTSDKKSASQIHQRNRYLFAASLLHQISPSLSLLYPSRKVKMNPFSYALSYLLKNCIPSLSPPTHTITPVIFSNLIHISGHPDFLSLNLPVLNRFQITLQSTKGIFIDYFHIGERLIIILFNHTKNLLFFTHKTIEDNPTTFTIHTHNTIDEDDIFIYIASQDYCSLHPGQNILYLQHISESVNTVTIPTADSTSITIDNSLFTIDKIN